MSMRQKTDETLQSYFNQIKAIPLLTFEEELELSQRINEGDTEAWKTLIQANLRLVVKIARSYANSDVSIMDVIQEGNIGLMHAAEKYDYKKNVRFSTYASWWIRQSISRYLTNRRRAIRLPNRKEETLRKIQKAYHVLSQSLQHQPKNEEIAAHLMIPVEDVDYILNITNSPLSLESDLGDDENAAMMDLNKDYRYNPEIDLMRKSFHADTMRVLEPLKEREKSILIYRYQLNGGEQHTLKKIGDKMGISPETVRQIEIKALAKLRENAGELCDSIYIEAI